MESQAPRFPMIDTHCHVHFNAYKEDMDDVVRRTLEKGVRMITVGTQATTSANGLRLAERHEGVWASVGLHPNHLCEQEFYDEQEGDAVPGESHPTPGVLGTPGVRIKTRCETFDHATYLELARHPKCVAIGECGLDYYRLPEHLDRVELIAQQKVSVRQQFDLAHEVGLPVIIHCRDAHADQQAIIREYAEAGKLQRRGVIHCFTGTLEEAKAYVELGFLISFTGVITFPPRKSEGPISPLQTVVRDLPIEHMMIETDAPYLTPVPHRGERNEPWMVTFVAEKISELKKVSLEEVSHVTTENAKRLFGI